jgi:hypothetical protein
MSDTITLNFSCPRCSGAITWPEDAINETPIVCKPCDVQYGTYGELKALANSKAEDHVGEMVKDAFKGLKGWEVT